MGTVNVEELISRLKDAILPEIDARINQRLGNNLQDDSFDNSFQGEQW